MSTNFYMKHTCSACNHERKVHLGKNSLGWKFSFAGDREAGIVNLATWLVRIKTLLAAGWVLVDEYGEPTPLEELQVLIYDKTHAGDLRNHALEYPNSNTWTDESGNSFSEGEWF